SIRLGRDGRARVADFGLVQDSIEGPLTHSHHVLGTPAYLAPEQALGKEVDTRADIYAVGAVLYTMLCGQPPYSGEIPSAVIGKLLHEDPPALDTRRPGVPPPLAAICERAMARNPADRYQSASSLAEALESFVSEARVDSEKIPSRASRPSGSTRTDIPPRARSRALRTLRLLSTG